MRIALILFGLFFVQNSFANVKVAYFLNEGFKGEEYYTPRKLMEAAGFDVKVVTRYPGFVNPTRTDQANKVPSAKSDFTYDNVNPEKFDLLVFAGGGGAWADYFPNKTIHKILKDAFDRNQWLGLICAGTGVLGTANNLYGDGVPLAKGRHVTGLPEVSGLLIRLGQVNYDKGDLNKPKVVVDGHLVTGRDPMSAQLFGETLVASLQKK